MTISSNVGSRSVGSSGGVEEADAGADDDDEATGAADVDDDAAAVADEDDDAVDELVVAAFVGVPSGCRWDEQATRRLKTIADNALRITN